MRQRDEEQVNTLPRGVRQDGGQRAAADLVSAFPPAPSPSRARLKSGGGGKTSPRSALPRQQENAPPMPPRGGGPHAPGGSGAGRAWAAVPAWLRPSLGEGGAAPFPWFCQQEAGGASELFT